MINYTAWPEMLAWPYLIIQGWLPYKDIAIAHNPLLLLDLVIFFKIFGVGIIQLKIYTWILIAINTSLVYLVGRKFWTTKIAVISSIIYILLVIIYQGNALWFDLALTPFAILLYYFVREKNYLISGIVFALGFLTKQTFIYFALPVIILILQTSKLKIKSLFNFVFGFGIIFTIFITVLFCFGILDDYYKWAIEFGIFYLPSAGGQVLLPNLKQLIFALAPFSIFAFVTPLLPWAIVGALGAWPRWELFHFQPALPFLALAISVFILSKKNILIKLIAGALFVMFLLVGIKRSLGVNIRFYEPDVLKVASLINSQQPKVTSLYVINYWDNLYALTNTLPSKPLIPYIPWYLEHNNNLELVVNSLKSDTPEMIVIGERQNNNQPLYEFVDKFYICNIVEEKIELCEKNK